ncbi:probable cytochrome P450 49a1 [Chelonus insularis]|uniref:probable cytochrome P450 49a1 n=1 Tax=Chelonus insularis TaxID=460826 RepID=UPI00158BACD4|nr:probable cytochrome P450 49a1 [Chelonus insularis]
MQNSRIMFIKNFVRKYSSIVNNHLVKKNENYEIKFDRNASTLVENINEEQLECVRPYKEIPGPKPLPLLGNTWRFIPYVGDFNIQSIDKVSQRLYEKYGDIVKIEGLIGRPDMVFLYDADEIQRIFRQEETMPHRPSMPSLNYYKHILRKDFFKDNGGLIAVHGESWYQFRSKVQQVMLQPRIVSLYTSAIEESSLAFIRRIQQIRDESNEVPDDFLNEINKWSLESIAKVALDLRLGCMDENANLETQQLIDAVHTFFTNVGILELKFPFWKLFKTPKWCAYVNALDYILSFTSKYSKIAMDHSKKIKKETQELSLLERILKMDDNNSHLASILALDLFLVGIDTTATAVGSILYQLALHPEKQSILHEEIARELPVEDNQIERKHLDNLRYLKACIRETLRMYPVVIGNGRCMTKDTVIKGYHIPKGVQVVFQHYVISNQERYFSNCNQFLPERWLNDGEQRHGFASLPFGFGRRMCIGRRFADLEITIVISKIIQKFRVDYRYGKMEYHINPLYTPKGPLRLRFIER